MKDCCLKISWNNGKTHVLSVPGDGHISWKIRKWEILLVCPTNGDLLPKRNRIAQSNTNVQASYKQVVIDLKMTCSNTSQVKFDITDEYRHYVFHEESCTFFTSSIFLIATFLVYAILPEIRKTSGGCYVLCQFISICINFNGNLSFVCVACRSGKSKNILLHRFM